MNVQVTSASKKEQKFSQVAAAIFVITQEDVQRSGATNIPDLLRMIPGLEVAQIDGNTWAISARGFNLQFGKKLLVLIDGRAVYTPLFGGVDWDVQDVPLEDIERIEVIRGPGGSVWGANAVNGVINVITKTAAETQGAMLTGEGEHKNDSGPFNTGESWEGDELSRFHEVSGHPITTRPRGARGSTGGICCMEEFARTRPSANDSLTVQGDLYAGNEGATIEHAVLSTGERDVQKIVRALRRECAGALAASFCKRFGRNGTVLFRPVRAFGAGVARKSQ